MQFLMYLVNLSFSIFSSLSLHPCFLRRHASCGCRCVLILLMSQLHVHYLMFPHHFRLSSIMSVLVGQLGASEN